MNFTNTDSVNYEVFLHMHSHWGLPWQLLQQVKRQENGLNFKIWPMDEQVRWQVYPVTRPIKHKIERKIDDQLYDVW